MVVLDLYVHSCSLEVELELLAAFEMDILGQWKHSGIFKWGELFSFLLWWLFLFGWFWVF